MGLKDLQDQQKQRLAAVAEISTQRRASGSLQSTFHMSALSEIVRELQSRSKLQLSCYTPDDSYEAHRNDYSIEVIGSNTKISVRALGIDENIYPEDQPGIYRYRNNVEGSCTLQEVCVPLVLWRRGELSSFELAAHVTWHGREDNGKVVDAVLALLDDRQPRMEFELPGMNRIKTSTNATSTTPKVFVIGLIGIVALLLYLLTRSRGA